MQPCIENVYLAEHCDLLIASYRHWTGRELIDAEGAGEDRAKALFEAPFALVSHGTEEEPIFNYGNRTALELFEVDWDGLVRMPSRESAEPVEREERERLFEVVNRQGFTDEYAGIRITASGRRFHIGQATVWTVMDDAGTRRGHAAVFSSWKYL
jgi:hypothetical protein